MSATPPRHPGAVAHGVGFVSLAALSLVTGHRIKVSTNQSLLLKTVFFFSKLRQPHGTIIFAPGEVHAMAPTEAKQSRSAVAEASPRASRQPCLSAVRCPSFTGHIRP